MNENIISGIGGMDEDKMLVELVKLLKEQHLNRGSDSQTLISIRESNLTETERLCLAFLYGKHVGSCVLLDQKNISGALTYLTAMAQFVLMPIEEVEQGYAELRDEVGGKS